MQIFVIKAICRATSKTLLIRAKSYEQALKKAQRQKEFRDIFVEFQFIGIEPDDRLRGL